jgi:hypothetical protein
MGHARQSGSGWPGALHEQHVGQAFSAAWLRTRSHGDLFAVKRGFWLSWWTAGVAAEKQKLEIGKWKFEIED